MNRKLVSMKIARIGTTVALLLFVGATVGVLIAQEVSHASMTEEPTVQGNPAGSDGERTESADEDVPRNSEVTASDVAVASTAEASSEPTYIVDAIYFHNTVRCFTCKKIEETAKVVMEAGFADEFATGSLRWSTVNMEKQRHYVEEYNLVKPTLVLIRSVGNEVQEWVALDETWSLIGSETRFPVYIAEQVRMFLGGNP